MDSNIMNYQGKRKKIIQKVLIYQDLVMVKLNGMTAIELVFGREIL